MKQIKKLKKQLSPIIVGALLVGFGAGYATKEFVQKSQNNLELPQHNILSKKPSATLPKSSINVCFTPNKQCQVNIIDAINTAMKSIYVQAYSFTDKDIAQAIARAAMRKVEIKVILDKSNRNDNRSAKNILNANNIPLRFDTPNGIAHNKILIIDEKLVITGSYNFSVAAYKRNTENVLFILDSNLARIYIQNWQARWNLSYYPK